MAADEQKIFEQTILDTISQISADRDEIAAGLNAKGLNIPVGSTLSEIAFTASDTSDDSAIKASPTQFGQVKILSDDSSVDTYQLSSPVVFNAKYVNDELTSLSNSVDQHVDDLNSKDNILSTAIETLDNVINLNAYKNGELSNSISSQQFNMYYGTLRNLGCNVDSFGKCHLNNIALYRGGNLPGQANNAQGANVTPVYLAVARLLNQSVASSWYFSHKSTNSIQMSAYELSSEMIFGMQTVSGSNEIDADEMVKIFFLSSNTFDYPGASSTNYVRAVAQVISSNTSSLVGLQTKPYDNTPSSNLSLYKPLVSFYDVVNLTTTENIDNRIQASLTGINDSITSINGNINTINSNINYLSGELSTVVKTTIPGLDSRVGTLNSTVGTLSTNLSTVISTVINTDIPNLTGRVDTLETTITSKASIKIGEGLTATPVDSNELIIKKVSPEEYAELLATQTTDILSNEMYIISADYLIGFDNKIVDVADGTEPTDAATFGQLSALSNEVAELKRTVQTLSEKIDQLTATA